MNKIKRYLGAAPFTKEHKNLFFGRKKDEENICSLIRKNKETLIYSRSGIGKSSIINAGIIPRVSKTNTLCITIRFGKFNKKAPDTPLNILFKRIEEETTKFLKKSCYYNTNEPAILPINKILKDSSLWYKFKSYQYEIQNSTAHYPGINNNTQKIDYTDNLVNENNYKKNKKDRAFPPIIFEGDRLLFVRQQAQTISPLRTFPFSFLIIFDQFEEFFTYPYNDQFVFKKNINELLYRNLPNRFRKALIAKEKLFSEEDKSTPFFREEEYLLLQKEIQAKVLISIREDYYSNLNNITDSLPNLLHNQYKLAPLSGNQIIEAIEEPAKVANPIFFRETPFEYEKEAINKIVNFLSQDGENAIETTQLGILCSFIEDIMIQDSSKKTITAEDIPDFKDIFLEYYNDCINKLRKQSRNPIRKLIENELIREGQRMPLKKSICISILEKEKVDVDQFQEILEILIDKNHLLRVDTNIRGEAYEIAHDSLVTPILEAKKLNNRWNRNFTYVLASSLVFLFALGAIYLNFWKNDLSKKKATNLNLYELKLKKDKISQNSTHSLLLPQTGLGLDIIDYSIKNLLPEVKDIDNNISTSIKNIQIKLSQTPINQIEKGILWHDEKINASVFSEDGRYVLTGANDSIAKLWTIDGLLIQEYKHQNIIACLAITTDGKKILVGTKSGGVILWDSIGNKLSANKHDSTITTLDFSHNGDTILSGSINGELKIWDSSFSFNKEIFYLGGIKRSCFSFNNDFIISHLQNDKIKINKTNNIQPNPYFSSSNIHDFDIKSDSNLVLFASGKDIIIHNLSTNTQTTLQKNRKPHRRNKKDRNVTLTRFCLNNQYILTVEEKDNPDNPIETGKITLWKHNNLIATERENYEHLQNIEEISLSLIGNSFLSKSVDGKVKHWDFKGNLIQELEGNINRSSFSPRGEIFTFSTNSNILEIRYATQETQSIINTRAGVNSIHFSPSNSINFISGGYDNIISNWTVNGFSNAQIVDQSDVDIVKYLTTDKPFYVSVSKKTIKIWNAKTKELVAKYRHNDARIKSIDISKDGSWIIAKCIDATILILAFHDGEIRRVHRFIYVHDYNFSKESNKIWISNGDSLKRITSIILPTFKESYLNDINNSFLKDSNEKIILSLDSTKTIFAVHPHNDRIFALSEKGNIKGTFHITNIRTRSKIKYTHGANINLLKFSPNGHYLMTAGEDNSIKIWDTGKDSLYSQFNHNRRINQVEFINSSCFVSSSQDNSARIWEINDGLLATLPHENNVTDIGISSNKKYLATASWDKTIKVWDINKIIRKRPLFLPTLHRMGFYIKETDWEKDYKNPLINKWNRNYYQEYVIKKKVHHAENNNENLFQSIQDSEKEQLILNLGIGILVLLSLILIIFIIVSPRFFSFLKRGELLKK